MLFQTAEFIIESYVIKLNRASTRQQLRRLFFINQGLWEELNEATAAYIEAFKQQDVEKAALAYTEDCSVMVPGYDVAHGREGKGYRAQRIAGAVYFSSVLKL